MPQSANVKSIDAVRRFAAAVVQFREEAQLCVTRLESEIRGVIDWLEHNRPGFWKQESELCARRHAEARVMLHQPHGAAQGQATDIEIQAKLIVQMREQLNQILADHTGQDLEKVAQDTERDYWMLADEAKEYGAIDGVLTRRELAAVASSSD